jgi:hypothetical protein
MCGSHAGTDPLEDIAAISKFTVKRYGASGDSNGCIPVALRQVYCLYLCGFCSIGVSAQDIPGASRPWIAGLLYS